MKVGINEVGGITSKGALMQLAASIGEIIPHPNGEKIATLIPSTGEKSIRGSFSSRYGLTKFPLHTDTAFWPTPARYVVMGMVEESSCSTTLVKWADIFSRLTTKSKQYASTATYMIDNIEGKRYSSLLFTNNGIKGLRFDPSCMRPINNAAKLFHLEFCEALNNAEVESIAWTGEKAVIIDNWKCLHGRASAVSIEKERELLRIYVR